MPITIELRENDRVLYYVVSDPWTFQDLTASFAVNTETRNQHPFKIHAIANLSASTQLPKDIFRARFISPDVKHPRAGYVIMIKPSPLVRSVIDMTIRLLGTKKIQFAATEEEAWATIRQIISSESNDSPD